MAERVTVNGVPTWYDQRGDGEPLVLLHGGLTDSRCFAGNLDTLADRFRVYLPERRGHGHTPDVDGPITMDLMAADTIAFLDKVVGGPARLVGYSAGGMVALLVAQRRPDLVERLVLVSTAYHLDGMIFRPTAGEAPPAIVDAYAEVSPDGRDHFPVVLAKIVEAANSEEPAVDLGGISTRTLVLVGDDDMVRLDHTVALYQGLADAELAVVPNATHLLLFEKPQTCADLVADFLTNDRPSTLMPIRRAQ